MTYKITDINKAEVDKLIIDKLNREDTIERNINNMTFKLKRITVPIDKMYYNIRNVRTSIETREYIKINNLDSNFFDIGEYHNIKVQQAYHSVIYKEVLDKKKTEYDTKFKTNRESQTVEVYLNLDGILINGNSRISYWRENQTFQTIDCLVFCEDYKWMDLLAAVNHIDSNVDIREKYTWYNRANQAREFLESDNSTDHLKKIAKDCAYGTPANVLTAIDELEIAEEYLNVGYEGCSTFADFRDSGSGGGNNYYAFKDIAAGVKILKKLRYDPSDKVLLERELKQTSFDLIHRYPPGMGSIHTNLEELWKDANLKRSLNEMKAATDSTATGGGGLLDEPDDTEIAISDNVDSEPLYTPNSNEDDNLAILEKLQREKKVRMSQMDANKPAQNIRKMILDLNSLIENISSNTDMGKLKTAFQELIEAVEANKNKLP